MRYCLLIMIINLFVVLEAGAAAVSNTLSLKSHVEISKEKLSMADLMIDTLLNSDSWNNFPEIIIIDDFKGRKNLRLSKASVRNKIRQYLRSDNLELNIENNAHYITVSRETFIIDSKKIVKVAKRKLLKELEIRYQDINLQLTELVKDVEIYQSDYILNALWAGGEQLKRREKIWVEVEYNNKILKRIPVWFDINAKTQAWVLKNKVSKNTVFNHIMVENQLVDVTNNIGKPIKNISALQAMEFRYVVNEGRVLSQNMLRKLPAIKVGNEVSVKSVFGAVSINTSGLALSSGEIGEIVRIKSKSSDKEFKAYVIQPGMVQVKGDSL